MGKCPDCNAWDSLDPQTLETKAKVDPRASAIAAWTSDAALDDPAGVATMTPAGPERSARAIDQFDLSARAHARITTGIAELDRVLGGGFVPGSAILLGGDPGIGKSTLLLQAAGALAARGTRTLYVSSEESGEQVAMRAARIINSAAAPASASAKPAPLPSELFILAETSLSRVLDQAARVLATAPAAPPHGLADSEASDQSRATAHSPPVLIIDSVQMLYKADLDAFPGSLTQLRRCCAELVYFAKASGVTVVLVGHVTKDGQLAGPRMLEHLVDAVLYFEGDRYHAHRLVRAIKNRFGTTLELGLFEMTGQGLRQAEPGATLAAQLAEPPKPGSAVCPLMTGTRCLMVELQALTATGFLGAAKRKSSGLDANRLAMLIAVLEQHAGLRLADRDIFASSVGGIRAIEPAADLALLLAIAGAHHRRAVPPMTAVIGEVGLSGELRHVAHLQARLLECARLGYTQVIVPQIRGEGRAGESLASLARSAKLQCLPTRTINEAIALLH
jgi:DNA repair protein RadA/Sms